MPHSAHDLARRLARDPEAVCRHYLSNGRREGRYWLVGDVENTPGRSLYVRLRGPETGKGAAGKWTDAATGEHGDLLDLIAANRVGVEGSGFESDDNALVVYWNGGERALGPAPKTELADRLLDLVAGRL